MSLLLDEIAVAAARLAEVGVDSPRADAELIAAHVHGVETKDHVAAAGVEAHVIGGAKEASELDAMRAVEEGVRIAQAL